jgi:pseudouridylate synthase
MSTNLNQLFTCSPEVSNALKAQSPLVALETAVLTHGLPYPENIQLSKHLEEEIRQEGVVPATIGILGGKIHIGLTLEEIEQLGTPNELSIKVSRRDFGFALAKNKNGGTTVAGTLIAARAAGIRVFATGGIGGVHRDAPFDVSADLPELGRSPLVVVCAGSKSILDLPATIEVLETMGVQVIGYQTSDFPAFFSQKSGLPVNARVESVEEIAEIASRQWMLGIESAILVVTPPPSEVALPFEEMDIVIRQAVEDAHHRNIVGSKVTPFLLDRVNQLTGGESMKTNLALLRNNARLAAKIALALNHPNSHFKQI